VGGAGARGAFLLAVALILGIVLLQKFDKTGGNGGLAVGTSPKATTTTTRPIRTSLLPTSTTRPPRAPAEVKVLVANGTGTTGFAGKVTSLLQGANYNVLSPTDSSRAVDATLVEYKPDFEPEARAVAQLLALPASAQRPMEDTPPVASTRDADVLVIAGADIKLPGDTATTTSTIRR
jgi:hypothetical protein